MASIRVRTIRIIFLDCHSVGLNLRYLKVLHLCPACADFMALYKWFKLLTYLLKFNLSLNGGLVNLRYIYIFNGMNAKGSSLRNKLVDARMRCLCCRCTMTSSVNTRLWVRTRCSDITAKHLSRLRTLYADDFRLWCRPVTGLGPGEQSNIKVLPLLEKSSLTLNCN